MAISISWGARWSCGLLAMGLAGCVEPYMPEVVSANANYLVVDGFINGNGRSTFLLSRTINVAATTAPPPEKGAKVYIIDSAGRRYPLLEKNSGTYQSDSLTLDQRQQYRLSILTAANSSYASNLVPLKVTPPIDKISFRLADSQVQLLLSTHDASAQSRYYRWNFTETWEFNAAFHSNLEYFPHPIPHVQGPIDTRITPIYTCWRTERPTTIAQATSAQLSQDALTDYVVYAFPDRAERVKIRYSVLVSQVAETAEEFAYHEVLRKNTEAVGTVNDPLPSQITGNVHRVDNIAEPVIGFVGAHTVQSRRFFIDHTDLPPRNAADYISPYSSCLVAPLYYCSQGVCDVDGVIMLFKSPEFVPLDFITDPTLGDGISGASAECADCRTRGTSVKPSFW